MKEIGNRVSQLIKRETTSIKVNPELWKRAKIEAVSHDMQLSDVVEEAIEAWLELQKRKSKN